MGYVMVTGGKEAVEQAEKLASYYRVREADEPLRITEIKAQMRFIVDRVMGEGGLYSPDYAALALKQAEGDPIEAAFLLRAYRSTLTRNFISCTIDTDKMRIIRRISSAFKDIPGGQILGPTNDYTHHLLDFSLMDESDNEFSSIRSEFEGVERDVEGIEFKKVVEILSDKGYLARPIEAECIEPFDITRENMVFPAPRSARLQTLARGETGAMVALAYSSLRGYGVVHAKIGELRVGYVPVYVKYPYSEEGEEIYIGEIMITEVEAINSFTQNEGEGKPKFVLGYGLCFGHNEAKGIAMSLLDHCLNVKGNTPVHNEEFVLVHIDSIEASGFVNHLKLPHYVTFQSSLDRIKEAQERNGLQEEDIDVSTL
jgi:alpha-D-ribose 1-methylphosphonate 5-triphosphate synthase subunit PhnI